MRILQEMRDFETSSGRVELKAYLQGCSVMVDPLCLLTYAWITEYIHARTGKYYIGCSVARTIADKVMNFRQDIS